MRRLVFLLLLLLLMMMIVDGMRCSASSILEEAGIELKGGTLRGDNYPPLYVCRIKKFFAVLKGPDSKFYFFTPTKVIRVSSAGYEGRLSRNGSFPFSPYYPDAAAYSPVTGNVYLFKDEYLWQYRYFNKRFINTIQRQRLRSGSGFFDAAFAENTGTQTTIFLLKNMWIYCSYTHQSPRMWHLYICDQNQTLWIWDEQTKGVRAYSFHFGDIWKGALPARIDAAVESLDAQTTHFFNNVKFSNRNNTLMGEPVNLLKSWMGCNVK